MKKTAISVALLLGLTGCLGTVKKTNNLVPGMTIGEVKQLLGNPSQSQFIGNKLILKYSLHQYWKGWVPYYLAFDKDTNKLDSWFADEQEYYRSQQLWLQAMPSQVNIDANVHQELQGTIQHDVNIKQ